MKFTSFAYNIMLLDIILTGTSWLAVRRTANFQKAVLNDPASFITKNVVYVLSDRQLRLCWDRGSHTLECPSMSYNGSDEIKERWEKTSGLRECLSYIINTTL